MKLGTIEGGGTKFVVGVGDENGNIFEENLSQPQHQKKQ